MIIFANKNRILTAAIFSILLSIVYFLGLYKTYAIKMLQLKSYDTLTYLKEKIAPLRKDIDEIVIIKIDDNSFRRLKRRWPWPRTYLKLLLEKLVKVKPRMICVDLLMFGKEDKDLDAELAKVMQESGNIILTSYFDKDGRYTVPSKIFADSARAYGFVNRPRDLDYSVRRSRPVVLTKNGDFIDYSFAIKAAAYYYNIPLSNIQLLDNRIIIATKEKNIDIPLQNDNTILLAFSGKLKKFPNMSFTDVLLDDFDDNLFKDKIVIIGATAEIIHDIYPTTIGLLPGVAIVANDIYSTIKGYFIRELPVYFNILFGFLLVIIAAAMTLTKNILRSAISMIAVVFLLVFLGIIGLLRYYFVDYFSFIFLILFTYGGINCYKYIKLFIENTRLKTLAITDELTSLFTFRYFKLKLKNEFEKALSEGKDLGLVIMDIDYFKKFNDTFGHQQGNIVLKNVAGTVVSNSRKVDFVFRYGGEEFVVILLNTNQDHAVIYAENLRKKIKELKFNFNNVETGVTLSLGAAGLKESGVNSYQDLIEAADQCLLNAKQQGRDRVCTYQGSAN